MQTLSKDNTPKFIYVFGDDDSRRVESFGNELVAKWVGMNDDVWVYVYPFTEGMLDKLKGIAYFATNMLYFGASASSLGYKNPDEGVAR